ncbi:DMT family transporter [Clostridium sp. WILCCON 0269]|uniref:DMT family transporter n=1 Tax=Candidatus Clostridium eludens TaxID=3381663 RepID=A0ABW8SI35_9CLOT
MNSKIKIITSMLIFGSIGVFVTNINLPSAEVAFFRAAIGSLFLISAAFFRNEKISFKSISNNLLLLIVSGIALGLNWLSLFQAYKYTTVPKATLSYYFAPIFVIILSPIVLKEKLTWTKIMCIIMALVGLFLILNLTGNDMTASYNDLKGILYGLLGAVLYASVILMNKFIRNLSGFETTLIQLIMACITLFLSILYKSSLNISVISHKTWTFIIVIGIIHTGIAYLLYFTSIKELSGQSIAILSYIDPISAVFFAAVFLWQTMAPVQIAGGILILGSTFLSERWKTFDSN